MNEFNFKKKLFGKEIEVIIYDFDQKNSKVFIEEFYNEALRLQKIFNFFDKESELYKLNIKRKMKLSKDLIHVLKKSLKFAKMTSGKYNPAIGKNISLRKSGKEISNYNANYKKIKILLGKVELKDDDLEIDLGSIAKGYITDKLGEFLKSKGFESFVINSRGDLLFSGDDEHIIGIQNPRNNEKDVMKIKIKNCGVATSGDYNQFNEDYSKSHIINQNEIISVTVVAPKLEDADVLATAIFVSNENEIKNIMEKNLNAKALIIDKQLNKRMFNSFEEIVI